MAPSRSMLRNVRPGRQHGAYDEEHFISDSAKELDEDAQDLVPSEDEAGVAVEQSGSDLSGEDVEEQINHVSFGALLQAQNTLSRKRKRDSDHFAEHGPQQEALKSRLQELRSQKQRSNALEPSFKKFDFPANQSHEESLDSSDEGPSEEEAPSKSRSSKHAPATQSSKRQVTRKRTVIDVPKRVSRDPRFDALQQRSAHPGNSEKAYSFLHDYQMDEIAELKAGVKKARTEEDAEKLKRTINSMENRLKAKRAKEREQDILRRHRKEEKEKVLQGKQPFYLKKKDVKEKALVEKFKSMKAKDRQKLIEKRRVKEGQREKKRMPEVRRVAG